jgi:hypothetical protein
MRCWADPALLHTRLLDRLAARPILPFVTRTSTSPSVSYTDGGSSRELSTTPAGANSSFPLPDSAVKPVPQLYRGRHICTQAMLLAALHVQPWGGEPS